MTERSPRVNIGLPDGIISKLERYAKSRGSKPATEASYLLIKILDELEDEGKIPPEPESKEEALPSYESFAQLVMHNFDKLVESHKFELERLRSLMSGAEPTEIELLRVALVGKVSEEFAINLSQKKGNGQHGSSKRSTDRT